MISVQYLTYFMKVCQTHSMNKAAEELYISQPALSFAMKNLENELNVILFVRTNKGIKLTADGEVVLRHAQQILGQLSLLENLGENRDGRTLAVSAFPCMIPANVLVAFKTDPQNQACHLDYQECRVGQILDNIKNVISEIGILQYNNYQISVLSKRMKSMDLEMHDIGVKSLAVAVGERSPLYNKHSVALNDLYPYRLIRQKDDYYSYLTSEVSGDGLLLGDLDCDWIDSGVMIGALLESTDMFTFTAVQHHYMNDFKVRLIPVENPAVDIHFAWIKRAHTELSEDAATFIERVSEELRL